MLKHSAPHNTRRRLRACVVSAGLLGIGLAIAAIGCSRSQPKNAAVSPEARAPSIILILIDTFRADRVGAWGNKDGLTPALDRLAAEGTVFERVYAASPWTMPSVGSLFSGVYPSVHKATSYKVATGKEQLGAGEVSAFSPDLTTIAESLSAAGYQTAAFVSNPFIVKQHGFDQGFDVFNESFVARTAPADQVNAAAVEWLSHRDDRRPFFLYLHYMDTHAPYQADPSYEEAQLSRTEAISDRRELSEFERKKFAGYYAKSMRRHVNDPRHTRLSTTAEYWNGRYDACVSQVDAYIGELREKLAQAGILDEALLLITADHGEALGEHEYWGHGVTAWNNQLHVPVILRRPGLVPAGRRVEQVVSLVDVSATVRDFAGAASPSPTQSRSLRPLLSGNAAESRAVFAEAVNTQPGLFVVIEGHWKLLYWTKKQAHALYDLQADPRELTEVGESNPQIVARLTALLTDQLRQSSEYGRGIRATSSDLSSGQSSRLSALGYAGGGESDDNAEAPASQPAEEP